MLQDKSALWHTFYKEKRFQVFCELNLKIIKQDHAIRDNILQKFQINHKLNLTGDGLNLVRDVKEHLTQVFKGDGY